MSVKIKTIGSMTKFVEIGCLEEIPDEELSIQCKIVPCKVGGKPSWLALENIPQPEELRCEECSDPCVFLCQIYAPIEEKPECFHRTIFVFICKNEKCCQQNSSRNLLVFRSQLPQHNKYMPSSIDEKGGESTIKTPKDFGIHLCNVCGSRGPHMCSRCKISYYCSKSHQKIDWTTRHKKECGKDIDGGSVDSYMFPKFEISMFTEELDATDDDDSDSSGKEEDQSGEINDFEEYLRAKNITANDELDENDLERYAMSETDQVFPNFKKRVNLHPEQSIRYSRGGEPLWISSNNQLHLDNVPVCGSCKSPREFEFQIMPQMLFEMKEESLDWGVIVVYTCKSNCGDGETYIKEFAHKQDLIKDLE